MKKVSTFVCLLLGSVYSMPGYGADVSDSAPLREAMKEIPKEEHLTRELPAPTGCLGWIARCCGGAQAAAVVVWDNLDSAVEAARHAATAAQRGFVRVRGLVTSVERMLGELGLLTEEQAAALRDLNGVLDGIDDGIKKATSAAETAETVMEQLEDLRGKNGASLELFLNTVGKIVNTVKAAGPPEGKLEKFGKLMQTLTALVEVAKVKFGKITALKDELDDLGGALADPTPHDGWTAEDIEAATAKASAALTILVAAAAEVMAVEEGGGDDDDEGVAAAEAIDVDASGTLGAAAAAAAPTDG